MLKQRITTALLFGACLCLLGACSNNTSDKAMTNQESKTQTQIESQAQTQEDNGLQTVVEGKKAPDLSLVDKDGKPVTLADYAGKKVYINFWASWCSPCLDEMPRLETVYQKYKDNPDYVFLSVTSPNDAKFGNSQPADDSQETILAAAKKGGITYPVLFDQKDSALMSYTIRAFPSHVFINSDGTVHKVFAGELHQDLLEAGLEGMK